MSKHTPGPWKIEKSWDDFIVVGPNDEEIIWQDGNNDTPTISLPDARLIAAAPDLLAALEGILAVANVRIDDPRIGAFDAARAAVQKAKGES